MDREGISRELAARLWGVLADIASEQNTTAEEVLRSTLVFLREAHDKNERRLAALEKHTGLK